MTLPEHDSQSGDPDQMATGTASSGKGSAPISLDDSTVDALLSHPAVVSRIEAIAEAKAQGTKDRRIAKLENQFGDIAGVLEQLDLTPEQKARAKEIERDNLIKQLSDAVLGTEQQATIPDAKPGSPATPASVGGGTPVDVVGSFQAVGFDPTSITVEDFEFASQFKDEVSLKNALLQKRLEMEQASQANTVDGMVMPQSGAQPGKDTLARLRSQYEAELANIRRGDGDAVAQLKIKYRKQGLEIN